MPMLHSLLVFLHVLAISTWIGAAIWVAGDVKRALAMGKPHVDVLAARIRPALGLDAGAGIATIVTGALLWANNLALQFLPKSWLDIATSVHFYEAVLATLAIVVWHFYSIMFDPDVYPLNTAFLTGRVKKEERAATAKTAGD